MFGGWVPRDGQARRSAWKILGRGHAPGVVLWARAPALGTGLPALSSSASRAVMLGSLRAVVGVAAPGWAASSAAGWQRSCAESAGSRRELPRCSALDAHRDGEGADFRIARPGHRAPGRISSCACFIGRQGPRALPRPISFDVGAMLIVLVPASRHRASMPFCSSESRNDTTESSAGSRASGGAAAQSGLAVAQVSASTGRRLRRSEHAGDLRLADVEAAAYLPAARPGGARSRPSAVVRRIAAGCRPGGKSPHSRSSATGDQPSREVIARHRRGQLHRAMPIACGCRR